MLWDIEMDSTKDFKLTLQWVIDLFTRIFTDVFGFIAKEEGWEE